MAARGDHERAAGGRSFHAVRPEAFNYVWDNGIEPELEIDSGGVVEFTVRDASDEQLRSDSTSEDVARLDFDHVYPVPDFPFNVFPYVVAAWLVLGLGIVLFVPGLARRIGANLAEREGLAVEESPGS